MNNNKDFEGFAESQNKINTGLMESIVNQGKAVTEVKRRQDLQKKGAEEITEGLLFYY